MSLPTDEQGRYDLYPETEAFADMLLQHYREVRENREAGKNREAQKPIVEPIKIDVSHVKPLSEEEQDEYLQMLLGEETDDEED